MKNKSECVTDTLRIKIFFLIFPEKDTDIYWQFFQLSNPIFWKKYHHLLKIPAQFQALHLYWTPKEIPLTI